LELYAVAGFDLAEGAEEFLDGSHLLPVDRGEDIAGLDSGVGGRCFGDGRADQHAGRGLEAEGLDDFRCQPGGCDPEEGVTRLAFLEQFVGDVGGGCGRYGEAEGDGAGRRWDVGLADADDLAAQVDQGAPGIAG
jgi:hypothetical protein